jgi:hypothetical protein
MDIEATQLHRLSVTIGLCGAKGRPVRKVDNVTATCESII